MLFAEAVNGVKKVNTKLLSRLTVVWLVIAGFSVPAQAGNADETRNLFEAAGTKQTAKDFKPAPDRIKTDFGTLEFEGGAFPDG